MNFMRVADQIRARLAGLEPQRLELADESARHAGHAGARPEGESHFRLLIVAHGFTGRSRIERQRMVYAALGDLLRTDVHALSITALTPAEDAARHGSPGAGRQT
jgi:BolA protein